MIGYWCNGNTTGFGPVIRGSNPLYPTNAAMLEWVDKADCPKKGSLSKNRLPMKKFIE